MKNRNIEEKNMKNRLYHSVRHVNDDLRSLFLSADSHLTIDEERRRSALNVLRKEIEYKEVRLVVSRRRIWQNQLRYADRSMFIFHLTGCAFMLLLMVFMNMQNVDSAIMITSAMILAGILGSFSVLEVGRICFAKLAELSETCFFNVRQMAAFDMILSGIINLTALFAITLFAGHKWQIRLVQIGLYILVPFIFTQCACLGTLLTETGRRNAWLVAAIGVFLSVFYVILASMPRLYTESALFIWLIALLTGMVIFGIQIKTLFREIGKGEILCTN
ncbi:MAG: hypothetical protein K2J99_07545 [Lachnospiraceae bacterium]|nr:hypothetical protein [Lachnospiraceae bacterium]